VLRIIAVGRPARDGRGAWRPGARVACGFVALTLPAEEASVKAVALAAALLASPICLAADSEGGGLLGSWRLVSFQMTYEGSAPSNQYGEHPKGRLILGPDGRMAAVIVAGGRRFGPSDAERAALHRSMLAYTGRYRVEGNRFVTAVDASWNQSWDGTEQARDYRIEGDRLLIESRGVGTNQQVGTPFVARLVWERER